MPEGLGPKGIVQGFLDQHLSVAAGIRQQLAKAGAPMLSVWP